MEILNYIVVNINKIKCIKNLKYEKFCNSIEMNLKNHSTTRTIKSYNERFNNMHQNKVKII